MELTKKVPTTDKNQENNHLLRMLDREDIRRIARSLKSYPASCNLAASVF